MGTILLVIIYLAFISLGLPDSLLGATWPAMQPQLQAPLGMAGVLFMVIAGGTIVSSLSSGALLRRFGTGKVTLFSCVMTAGALLGFAFVPSVFWLIVCCIPLGLGGGSVDAGLNHYVAAHYKAHHMSWLHCFWGVGATAGPMIMAHFISQQAAWRDGYLAVAGIQCLLVAVLLASLPLWNRRSLGRGTAERASTEAVSVSASADDSGNGAAKPLKAKGVKLALLSFLLYCGVESTLGLWGSSFLVREHELPADTAAKWVSLYYAGITVGRFVTGFITFQVNNRLLIRGGQVVALTGVIVLLLPLPPSFALAGFLIAGLGLAPIYPCMLHETPVRFGKSNASTLMGYQMAVAYTGSTLMPPLLGWVAGFSSIGIFPIYLVLSAGAMLLLTERLNAVLGRKRPSAALPS
ncbi:MFS transporter [Paenibacillus flagellatus]|uniref:MFS transporter n=1 Tax=Paenibacillus flagellatus TaxID=2211139 RepID=A0A2V5K1I5_9BACL|nr:MFS transporter [Paenibacillus flagellatus]PYI51383.1 MFS transporter [Paenibacillus flagellatus]